MSADRRTRGKTQAEPTAAERKYRARQERKKAWLHDDGIKEQIATVGQKVTEPVLRAAYKEVNDDLARLIQR